MSLVLLITNPSKHPNVKKLVLLFFVVSSLLLSSCATTKGYVGPKQNKASLATIKQGKAINNNIFKNRTTIELPKIIRVDSITGINQTKCYILPGTHTVEILHFQIRGMWGRMTGYYLLTFCAEAGKEYLLWTVTDPEKNEVDIYVTNADNGERVESTVVEQKKSQE